MVMVQIVKYRLVGENISYLSRRLQTSSLFADDAATYRNNQCQKRRRLDDRDQATVGEFCSAIPLMLCCVWMIWPEARESEVPIIRERVIMTFGYFREKDPLSISIVCHNQYDFSIFWPQIARGRSIIIVVTVLLKDARERSLAKTLRNRNPSYLH